MPNLSKSISSCVRLINKFIASNSERCVLSAQSYLNLPFPNNEHYSERRQKWPMMLAVKTNLIQKEFPAVMTSLISMTKPESEKYTKIV